MSPLKLTFCLTVWPLLPFLVVLDCFLEALDVLFFVWYIPWVSMINFKKCIKSAFCLKFCCCWCFAPFSCSWGLLWSHHCLWFFSIKLLWQMGSQVKCKFLWYTFKKCVKTAVFYNNFIFFRFGSFWQFLTAPFRSLLSLSSSIR